MQHNCSLGHTEFCQCPDRLTVVHEQAGPHAVERVQTNAGLDGEASMRADGDPEMDEYTIKRHRVRQNGRVVATWFEDKDGTVYTAE